MEFFARTNLFIFSSNLMMRLLRWILIAFFCLVYLASSSPALFTFLEEQGVTTPMDYYGNLYRMEPLRELRKERAHCDYSDLRPAIPKIKSLVITGDSFVTIPREEMTRYFESLSISTRIVNIGGINPQSVAAMHLERPSAVVFEIVEHSTRNHFKSRGLPNKVELHVENSSLLERLRPRLQHYITLRGASSLAEPVIFGFALFRPFRETKAWLNLHWFERIEPGVFLSSNGKYLFFKDEYDSTLSSSAFWPISDVEVADVVSNINQMYTEYKGLGFDKFFLSLIPNKVSIVEPTAGPYNHLIERVQNTATLKMPIIDLYTPYRGSSEQLYYNADTHWRCTGEKMWMLLLLERLSG